MPTPQVRGLLNSLTGSPSRSLRLATALMLLAIGAFTSGFDARNTRQPPDVSAPPPATLPTRGSATAAGAIDSLHRTPGSRVVAEYEAVDIGSLPLREDKFGSPWPTATPLTVVTEGTLERGQSLSRALRGQGISSATINLIAREMRSVFNFRHSQPGDHYRLGQDSDGRVLDFRYSTSPEKSFYLAWEGTRYTVREDHAPLRTQLAKVSGVIQTSLYDGIVGLGEQSALASAFADVFAWDIDFSRSVRPGDDFQILYERLYRTDRDGREVYVKPGRILAARYRGQVGEHAVVFYEGPDGRAGYYHTDGTPIERAFLVAPLEYRRISSSFSAGRLHPILGVVRPHRGIDYAAAPGTPVWSVATGTVIFRGWAGASGNLVKVKHRSGYISYYAHLSRFEAGLKVGDSVSQKQVLGFVGQTGLATGPHVCFRIQKNGRYVNPMDIVTPAAEGIAKGDWPVFAARRDVLLSDLGSATFVAADEAL